MHLHNLFKNRNNSTHYTIVCTMLIHSQHDFSTIPLQHIQSGDISMHVDGLLMAFSMYKQCQLLNWASRTSETHLLWSYCCCNLQLPLPRCHCCHCYSNPLEHVSFLAQWLHQLPGPSADTDGTKKDAFEGQKPARQSPTLIHPPAESKIPVLSHFSVLRLRVHPSLHTLQS